MTEQAAAENHFSIQKLYIKDVSFESPSAPEVFTFDKWDPQIELNLNNASKKLNEGVYDVVLSVTATVSNQDKVAFLVEVHQGGIFQLQGFNEQDTKYILGAQCMTILFPYAREAVSDLTNRGGFPPLLLNPVNFDGLYAQAMQKQQQEATADEAEQ
ncbi:MAG: protein-export chaperone SecB [Gammaproteobacteria bacterium]|nr:protein-export chaperone SecB [Gammaproteobacteria bacterium]